MMFKIPTQQFYLMPRVFRKIFGENPFLPIGYNAASLKDSHSFLSFVPFLFILLMHFRLSFQTCPSLFTFFSNFLSYQHGGSPEDRAVTKAALTRIEPTTI